MKVMSAPPHHLGKAAWVVPAVVASVVVGAAVLPSTASADAHPNLPARTAGQLLAAVQTAQVQQLSGTVVETARLGLPDLPGADNASALSLQTLATGTHTFRVWLDGAERQRLALLGQLSESDVVHNGADLWTYDSTTQEVGHASLDRVKAGPEQGAEKVDTKVVRHTPQELAAEALRAIDPSTEVTVDRTARVAGRPAYTLVLTPRDARSTVRKVALALDAERSVPLRVQVFGAAAQPAFEIGFTDVSLSRPAASVFAFTPPRGAKVTPLGADGTPQKADRPGKAPAAEKAVRTLGSGWASVLALPAGSSPLGANGASKSDSTGALLGKLTTTLPSGDKALRTALVNALITHDGRVYLGAVSVGVLEQAAAGKLG